MLVDLSAIQQCDFKFWICMFFSMCGLFFPMRGWVDQSLMKLLMKEWIQEIWRIVGPVFSFIYWSNYLIYSSHNYSAIVGTCKSTLTTSWSQWFLAVPPITRCHSPVSSLSWWGKKSSPWFHPPAMLPVTVLPQDDIILTDSVQNNDCSMHMHSSCKYIMETAWWSCSSRSLLCQQETVK